MTYEKKLKELNLLKRKLTLGGGDEKIAAQHQRGKLTARERIELLLDQGTFVELNPFIAKRPSLLAEPYDETPGEGVVTCYGKINDRKVFIYAHDFTVLGGSLGEMHAQKIIHLMDLAAKNKAPLIGLIDSGGARIQDGVAALDGYGKIFYRNVLYSGVIPQISVIMGPSAGGAVYSPALTDFVIMVEETAHMFITGPKVIAAVTGKMPSLDALGSAQIHAATSGNVHFTATNDARALALVKKLLTYLPNHFQEKPPQTLPNKKHVSSGDALLQIVPIDANKPYDMKQVIHEIVDDNSFFEAQQDFAKNIVVGFARMNGKVVGLICNQPRYMAGSIDIDASDKAARFIRFCDAFSIPLITLEDVTGFYPSIDQEHGGVIRHGAKIIYAFAEATVPKITVILRKAYGGAFVALNSKALGADFVFAWPNAEIAVLGPEGAAAIIYAEKIKASKHPQQTKEEIVRAYKEKFTSPYIAASLGIVDEVIDPRETRIKLVEALEMLDNKEETRPFKKHGNLPL